MTIDDLTKLQMQLDWSRHQDLEFHSVKIEQLQPVYDLARFYLTTTAETVNAVQERYRRLLETRTKLTSLRAHGGAEKEWECAEAELRWRTEGLLKALAALFPNGSSTP